MPGMLIHVGTTAQCTHLASVSTAPTQTKVLVSGQFVATTNNQFLVTGCPFTVPGPKPQPCVQVKWSQPATKILINGLPALLQTLPGPGIGAGVCFTAEQLPQGQPQVASIQTRVLGS